MKKIKKNVSSTVSPESFEIGDLFNARSAAEALGCTRSQFRTLIKSGRLHGYKLGNRWCFTRVDIARCQAGQSPAPSSPQWVEPSQLNPFDEAEQDSVSHDIRLMLDSQQVADLLHITVGRVNECAKKGRFPTIKFAGRNYFTRSAVAQYIQDWLPGTYKRRGRPPKLVRETVIAIPQ